MDIIKALKENLAQFHALTKEQKQFLEDVGKEKCLRLNYDGRWVGNNKPSFFPDCIYRLRPDYKEEPGVVKKTVFLHNGLLSYCPCNDDRIKTEIIYASSRTDFIGFLYEDGMVSSNPRMYRDKKVGDTYDCLLFGIEDKYKVLTPTHVLFRRTE